ncbi:MAG: hypothetical protein Q8M98_11950 [Candidatus Cloacimonadaceae bacterium]|nr:hypothetical protein [Candidatus Cloacimonadaceae bacterium]
MQQIPTAIPITAYVMTSVLNLPTEMHEKPIFSEHSQLVIELIRSVVQEEYYLNAVYPSVYMGEAYYTSFRFGYCFYMLYSTCEFLNLKTLGEGIVKSVGLDQSATELLTGAEIDAFKFNLEKRALQSLSPYLSQVGKDRLEQLSPKVSKKFRAGVI